MRYSIILLFLASFVTAKAQQQPENDADSTTITEWYQTGDTTLWYRNKHLFEKIDTTKISSGILLDYGYRFTDLDAYNGESPNDTNQSSFQVIEELNSSLYSSRICSAGDVLPAPQQLYDAWKTHNNVNHFALSGILVRYQVYKQDSVIRVDTLDGRIHDRYVSGVWQDPYETKIVFAMAMPVNTVTGRDITVELPADMWITNMGAEVTAIKVDAGDGFGMRWVSPGAAAFTVHYTTEGEKEWQFELHLSNQQVLRSMGKIWVRFAKLTSSLSTVTAAEPFMGLYAQAKMRVQYANPFDPVLRKPLIIVEGFDPGRILKPTSEFGYTDMENIFEKYYEKIGITSRNELREQIDGQHYDLVFIDWVDGMDYLQRNALALEEVIRQVNSAKQPYLGVRQQNVVWGFSMGGVISRYALKDMEDKGQDHETRLFISHDAPHQGANVPIGFLAAADHLRNLYYGSGMLKDIISTKIIPSTGVLSINDAFSLPYQPAAAQMMNNHISTWTQGLHDTWQSTLRAKGYPNNCQNVAVSNGSECGLSQPVLPGELQFGFHGSIKLGYLANLVLNNIGMSPLVYDFVLGSSFAPPLILSAIPGSSKWTADFAVNGDGDYTDQRVYLGDITYSKSIFFFLPSITSHLSRFTLSRDKTYPWETYAGSYFSVPGLASGTFTNTFGVWGKFNGRLDVKNRFSFIPVASALDIGAGSVFVRKSIYSSRQCGLQPPAAPYNSPFNDFITEYYSSDQKDNNRPHIEINARNAEWVGQKIGGLPTTYCAGPCVSSNKILGPDAVCPGTPQAYIVSFANPTPAPAVAWGMSLSSPGIASMSATGNVCTVTGSGFGTVTLYAYLNNGCALSPAYTKTINIGAPPPYGTIAINYNLQPGGGYIAKALPYYPDMKYEWRESYYIGGSWGSLSYTAYETGTDEYRVKYKPEASGGPALSESVYVKLSNGCGNAIFSKAKPDPSFGWKLADTIAAATDGLSVSVSPNPAQDRWVISISGNGDKDRTIQLFDLQGRKLWEQEVRAAEPILLLDNSHLPAGIYLLYVRAGTETYSARLMKE